MNPTRRVTAGTAVALMALLFVLVFLIGLNVGSADLDIPKIISQTISGDHDSHYRFKYYILKDIRLPRLVLCMLTAVALGLSGCVMQNLLRNPLASPYTLGVSSGASFGAALAMVLGYGLFGANLLFTGYTLVAFNAFLFGCLSLAVVYGISKLCNDSITVLILTGTAIGSLFSAGISILKYVSDAEALKNLETWLMGGFWGANWTAIEIVAPFLLLGFVLVFRYAWDFNALNAGEDVAATLGVDVRRLKAVSLITVTLISSICIAFSGVIGFVGLVAPHIARSLVGVDNRYLIPASGLIGGIMLLSSDIIARTIISPEEIPVGIITAIIGVPFFIFILTRKKKQLWRDRSGSRYQGRLVLLRTEEGPRRRVRHGIVGRRHRDSGTERRRQDHPPPLPRAPPQTRFRGGPLRREEPPRLHPQGDLQDTGLCAPEHHAVLSSDGEGVRLPRETPVRRLEPRRGGH